MNRRLTATLLFGCAGAGFAQVAPSTPEYSEQVDVTVLELPITARDRGGAPIEDLRLDQLEVRLGRERLRVVGLEPVERRPDTSRSGAWIELDDPASGQRIHEQTRPNGSNLVLLIDVDSLEPARRAAYRLSLQQFIERYDLPGTRFAVVSWASEVELECDFTTDRLALLRALESAFSRPAGPRLSRRLEIEGLIQELEGCVDGAGGTQQGCMRAAGQSFAQQLVTRGKNALVALERALALAATRTGGRGVVMIGFGAMQDSSEPIREATQSVGGVSDDGGWLVDLDLRREWKQLTVRAAQAATSISIVEPELALSSHSARFARFEGSARPFEAFVRAARRDAEQLASTTNGSYHTGPELGVLLQRALDERKGRYRLEVALGAQQLTHRDLARIEVVSLRAGLRLSRGEFSRQARDNNDTLQGLISLGRPSMATELAAVRMPFRVSVDPHALGYRLRDSEWLATLALHAELYDQAGALLGDGSLFVMHSYAAEDWGLPTTTPVEFQGAVLATPGEYRLVVRLSNLDAGRAGVLQRSVSISTEAAR
jgi:hypothetical protein